MPVVKHFSIARALVGYYFRTVARDWYRRPPFLPVPPQKYVAWRLQTAYGQHRPPIRQIFQDLWQFGEWLRGFGGKKQSRISL
jgi:hypothetical protein